MITDNGIVLMYNGKNNGTGRGDKRFVDNCYSAGQILFDSKDPTKVIGRLDLPFLYPMQTFEKKGQYDNGTVFLEGLVYFKKKWFLYYGCADSGIGVAIYDSSNFTLPDR